MPGRLTGSSCLVRGRSARKTSHLKFSCTFLLYVWLCPCREQAPAEGDRGQHPGGAVRQHWQHSGGRVCNICHHRGKAPRQRHRRKAEAGGGHRSGDRRGPRRVHTLRGLPVDAVLLHLRCTSARITLRTGGALHSMQIGLDRLLATTAETALPVLPRAHTDLAAIDSMYQYSLPWFTRLVLASLAQASKPDSVPQRLEAIHSHFTASLYRNVCRWAIIPTHCRQRCATGQNRPRNKVLLFTLISTCARAAAGRCLRRTSCCLHSSWQHASLALMGSCSRRSGCSC